MWLLPDVLHRCNPMLYYTLVRNEGTDLEGFNVHVDCAVLRGYLHLSSSESRLGG